MRLFVGNGIGPLILASVAVAASTILSHAACMCDVSKDFNRILIFDAATGAAAASSAARTAKEAALLLCVFDEEDAWSAPPRANDGDCNTFEHENDISAFSFASQRRRVCVL